MDKKILNFELDKSSLKMKDILDKEFVEIEIYAISDAYPNRNMSAFTMSAMKDALPSFKNKPILGAWDIAQGDFKSHNSTLEYDDQLENYYYDYTQAGCETPLGMIRESDNVEIVYDKKRKENWIVVHAVLWSRYAYNQIKNLLKKSGQSKISVEIEVDKSHYDENNYEVIDKFNFTGLTILGTELGKPVEEGIEGAHLTVIDLMNSPLFQKKTKALAFAYNALDNYNKNVQAKEFSNNQSLTATDIRSIISSGTIRNENPDRDSIYEEPEEEITSIAQSPTKQPIVVKVEAPKEENIKEPEKVSEPESTEKQNIESEPVQVAQPANQNQTPESEKVLEVPEEKKNGSIEPTPDESNEIKNEPIEEPVGEAISNGEVAEQTDNGVNAPQDKSQMEEQVKTEETSGCEEVCDTCAVQEETTDGYTPEVVGNETEPEVPTSDSNEENCLNCSEDINEEQPEMEMSDEPCACNTEACESNCESNTESCTTESCTTESNDAVCEEPCSEACEAQNCDESVCESTCENSCTTCSEDSENKEESCQTCAQTCEEPAQEEQSCESQKCESQVCEEKQEEAQDCEKNFAEEIDLNSEPEETNYITAEQGAADGMSSIAPPPMQTAKISDVDAVMTIGISPDKEEAVVVPDVDEQRTNPLQPDDQSKRANFDVLKNTFVEIDGETINVATLCEKYNKVKSEYDAIMRDIKMQEVAKLIESGRSFIFDDPDVETSVKEEFASKMEEKCNNFELNSEEEVIKFSKSLLAMYYYENKVAKKDKTNQDFSISIQQPIHIEKAASNSKLKDAINKLNHI